MALAAGCAQSGYSSSSSATDAFVEEAHIFTSELPYHNPMVIRLPNSQYRMFFHNGNRIMSAISDNGTTFTVESGDRLTGEMPAVIDLPDGTWRMYYATSDGVKSAVSTDAFVFTVESGLRLLPGSTGSSDANGLVHLSVIRLPDNTYKMVYDGVNGLGSQGPSQWTIMSATSPDGLTWTKDAGQRISSSQAASRGIFSAWSADIHYENGQYQLYFSVEANPLSKSGVWRATSTDGVNFTIDYNPTLGRDTQYGNQEVLGQSGYLGVPQDPFLMTVTGGQRLYYWKTDAGTYCAWKAA
jgi:hypothetical protein